MRKASLSDENLIVSRLEMGAARVLEDKLPDLLIKTLGRLRSLFEAFRCLISVIPFLP